MAGRVAIVGASDHPGKYGSKAVRAYRRAGWQVYPVNPRGGTIDGQPVYASLAEIPVPLDRVSLYLPPAIGVRVLPEIAAVQPGDFYVNPGAESVELLQEARRLGLQPITACSIVALGEVP